MRITGNVVSNFRQDLELFLSENYPDINFNVGKISFNNNEIKFRVEGKTEGFVDKKEAEEKRLLDYYKMIFNIPEKFFVDSEIGEVTLVKYVKRRPKLPFVIKQINFPHSLYKISQEQILRVLK